MSFFKLCRLSCSLSSLGARCTGDPIPLSWKYGVPISQWAWLYQALLEVSMNKLELWINVCADDWITERMIITSNALTIFSFLSRLWETLGNSKLLPPLSFEKSWIHHLSYLCSLRTTYTFPALTANCAETHKTEQQQRSSRDVQFTANRMVVIKYITKLDELLNKSNYAVAWKFEL